MDKKIIYGIGGVALVGIAYYLYNKSKTDATKIGAADLGAPDTSTPILDLTYNGAPNLVAPSGEVAPILGNSQTGFYSPAPGTTQDGKFTPTPSTENVTAFVDPSIGSGNMSNITLTRPSTPSTADATTFVDPMIKTPISSSPVLTRASFDGGFSYADGGLKRTKKGKLNGFLNVTGKTTTATPQKLSGCYGTTATKCPTCYRCSGGTCYPAYQVVIPGQPSVSEADFNNCVRLYGGGAK